MICKFLVLFIMLVPMVDVRADVTDFHIEASRQKLLAGDAYNITCWSDKLTSIQELCGSLDKVYIQQYTTMNSTNLNSTAIYHEVKSALPKHKRNDNYKCMCGSKTLAETDFMVGVRLQIKDEDFDCQFLDYKNVSTLECTFTKPTNSTDVDQKTSFELLHNKDLDGVKCVESALNNSQMLCTVRNFNKFFPEFKFILRMNNSEGVHQEQLFDRTRDECIVMEQPGKNIIDVQITIDSVCLEWGFNQQSNHLNHNIDWHYLVEPPYYKSLNWTIWKKSINRESFCLTGLSHPYQLYTLTLKRRYDNPRAHWSQPFVYSFITNATIPSRPPIVWPGGYLRRQELRVYWQQLHDLEHNGPNFTYSVSVWNTENNAPVQNAKIEVTSNMAIIADLNYDSGPYKVIVKSQNNKGESQNSSEILISNFEKGRIPTDLRIDKSKHEIRWTQPKQEEHLQGYTVYWCAANVTERGRCNDTVAIESQEVKEIYFVNDKAQDDSYEWAVSANYKESSSLSGGMKWLEWNHLESTDDTTNRILHSLEGIVALFVLVLIYYIFRKFQYMSDIKVDLPPGILEIPAEHQELLATDIPTDQNISMLPESPMALSAYIMPQDVSTLPAEPAEPDVHTDTNSSYVQTALALNEPSPTDNHCRAESNISDYISMQPLHTIPAFGSPAYVMIPNICR